MIDTLPPHIHLLNYKSVSYTHLRAHETRGNLVCRLLLEKKFKTKVSASYNIAPSQDVLVLKPNPEMIKWSYSPKWKEDMNLINCRHETLLEKPSFKGSMRCVFIANGWIEWQRLENEKKPFFHLIRNELIYFAGIYNLTSGCAVVTCQSSQHISKAVSYTHLTLPTILLV